MVDDVDDHLPVGRGRRLAVQRLVFDHAMEAGGAKAVDECPDLRLKSHPRVAKRGHAHELARVRPRGRRLPLPAAVLDPLGEVDVDERVEH